MPTLKKDGISQICVDGELISRPPEPENIDLENTGPVLCFSNRPVTHTEILESIQKLQPKNLLGFNGISMFFLKKVLIQFPHVIPLSLSTRIVPTQLKIAKVIPSPAGVWPSGARIS
jgi:hypothetical protein